MQSHLQNQYHPEFWFLPILPFEKWEITCTGKPIPFFYIVKILEHQHQHQLTISRDKEYFLVNPKQVLSLTINKNTAVLSDKSIVSQIMIVVIESNNVIKKEKPTPIKNINLSIENIKLININKLCQNQDIITSLFYEDVPRPGHHVYHIMFKKTSQCLPYLPGVFDYSTAQDGNKCKMGLNIARDIELEIEWDNEIIQQHYKSPELLNAVVYIDKIESYNFKKNKIK